VAHDGMDRHRRSGLDTLRRMARALAPASRPRSVGVPTCFFVQARYDGARPEDRWTTVAAGARRGEAIEYAAEVYRALRRPGGEAPRQVRVISEASLRSQEGDGEVDRAFEDVSRAAERWSSLPPSAPAWRVRGGREPAD
jgi:hypothetical protein